MSKKTEGKMIRKTICLILLLFVCVLILPKGTNATIFVDDDNNQSEDGSFGFPYNTIQEGVNSAEAGEDVIIREGSYGPFVINHNIQMIRIYAYGYFNGSPEMVMINTSTKEKPIGVDETKDIFIAGLTLRSAGGNDYGGMTINNTHNLTLEEMEIYIYSDYGINILQSTTIRITECNIHHNSAGIIIINCMNNTRDCINITNSSFASNYFGIKLVDSMMTNIENNNIIDNKKGISLYDSSLNDISNNHVEGNRIRAISIHQNSTNNIIHHNTILSNGWNISQGYDEGSNNTWDNGTEGNWWSDYEGLDIDQDGIGDTPYPIESSYNVTDRYPFSRLGGFIDIDIILDSNPPLIGHDIEVFVNIQVDFNASAVILIFWLEWDDIHSNNAQRTIDLLNGDNWFNFTYHVEKGTQIIGITLLDPLGTSESLTFEAIQVRSSGNGLLSLNIISLIFISIILSLFRREEH